MKEFTSAAELRAHYREVFARRPKMKKRPVIKVAPPPPPPDPEPEPPSPSVTVPIPDQRKWPAMKQVMRLVCEHYKVEWSHIASPSRVSVLVRPRQVFCFVAHRVACLSFPRIGEALQRDHSTVMHGDRQIAQLIMTCPEIAADVDVITERFKALRSKPWAS